MSLRVFQPLVEVFLLVEQPRQRLSHWTQALAPIDRPDAPPVATVEAYYDPTSNQAIFGLRYDEHALGPNRLGFLVELALLAEIGMIQPAELSEAERVRFIGERLSRCTVHVGDQRQIVRALVELVRRIRTQKPAASSTAVEVIPSGMPRVPAGAAPSRRARASAVEHIEPTEPTEPIEPTEPTDPTDPMPAASAGGMPDFGAVESSASHVFAHGSVREPKSEFLDDTTQAEAQAIPELFQKQAITEPITSRARRRAAALLPPRRGDIPRPSPNMIARTEGQRADMVARSPVESHPMIEAVSEAVIDATESGRAETAVDVLTEPYLPAGDPRESNALSARYLRSGRWVRIRLSALSLKGATMMAGPLPRLDDLVEVGVAYANYRALVRGVVEKVSTFQESASSGTTTFSVRFELDEASRRELTALLTAARRDKVTLKPAPMRSTRRYAVEWPISLGTGRGAVRAEALDVSTDGMFVKPPLALALDARLTFSAVLDDGVSQVSGSSRVVRTISDADARVGGLAPGYGLNILEMPPEDRQRWSAFLARIDQRAGKRVLIGASPERLVELQSGLAAAGYAVTGGSAPGKIAQLANAETHPVDAALIDASWLAAASSSRVESLFTGRKVPCVTVHGDVQRALVAVDRLLSVV